LTLIHSQCSNKLPYSATPDGFCPRIWASGLSRPRGMVVASNGDILVLEAGAGRISVLYDVNNDGVSDLSERAVLVTLSGLNHGIEIYNGYLYASTPQTTYRWVYRAGTRTALGQSQIVVNNVPCCHHSTRTLRFDKTGNLFLQSGSGSNVDSDSSHSQIRKFNVSTNGVTLPLNWNKGELSYNGLRNTAALRFDKMGNLWSADNGIDNLVRTDLGGDIHNDNPPEEVNLLIPGEFYGYPYCWSEGKLPANRARGPGSQWVHPDFVGTYTDDWCIEFSRRPMFNLPPHSAPLDIIFYYNSSFPSKYQGNAFVALHGSWNRDVPTGYQIVHLVFNQTNVPIQAEPFLYHSGDGARWPNSIRPVGLAIAKCLTGDCLYVSSDQSGHIIEVSYKK